MALLIDTGVLYAHLDAADPDHAACAALLAGARETRVVPAPVFPEVDYLLQSRGLGHGMAALLAQVRSGALTVIDLAAADYDRIDSLLTEYADLRVGFVDAAVLALAERLCEPKLATLDRRHFTVMRPRHVDALELLPRP